MALVTGFGTTGSATAATGAATDPFDVGHTNHNTTNTAQMTAPTALVSTAPGCFCATSATPRPCLRCNGDTSALRTSPRPSAASNALDTSSGSMSNSFA